MNEKRVLFRCNADHATGFGHVSRCLSVARELRQSVDHICFALGSGDAVRRVQGSLLPYFPVMMPMQHSSSL